MNIASLSRHLFYVRCAELPKSKLLTTSSRLFYTLIHSNLCRSNSSRSSLLFRAVRTTQHNLIKNLSKVSKRESAKVRNLKWKDLRNIFGLAYPYRFRIAGGLFFLVVGNSIGLALPRLIFLFVDVDKEIDESNPDEKRRRARDKYIFMTAKYLKDHVAVLLSLFLVTAIAYGLRHYCMHTAGQLVINNLRREVFNSVISQEMNFFTKNRVGELVSRLSTDTLIVGQSVTANLTGGARSFMTFFGSVAIMMITSPELSKVVAALTAAIVSSGYFFGNLQRKYTLLMQEAVAAANEVATEKFSNIVTVRTLVSEARERETYRKKICELWKVACREGRATGSMMALHEFSILASLYAIVFYGSSLMGSGVLSYGDLLAFIWYASLCALSLPGMVNFYTDLMKGLGASGRLFELRHRVPRVPIVGGIVKRDLNYGIAFQSVSFGYPDRPLLFTNVSFFMPAGKVTAIVGASGSGKSSIANLVLRLQEPLSGRIAIDDIDLNDLDPSHWRRCIGTVAQEPVLFSTTIRNNILYGAENPESISTEQLERAAEQANALYFIRSMPDQFDTLIGEQGSSTLSGGQRQRIAIARALIKDPIMLILDEATSALDAASEDLVRLAISRLLENSRKTVLIIAHRLSTVKYADRIVVLNDGAVVECGTFDELMTLDDGVFKQLIEKQAIGYRR